MEKLVQKKTSEEIGEDIRAAIATALENTGDITEEEDEETRRS
jgi:hypothetical protein